MIALKILAGIGIYVFTMLSLVIAVSAGVTLGITKWLEK